MSIYFCLTGRYRPAIPVAWKTVHTATLSRQQDRAGMIDIAAAAIYDTAIAADDPDMPVYRSTAGCVPPRPIR